ncbi:MAG: hypothetical protein Q8K63_08105, partial [Acidimicrobiales bacterium]|nr:hypothetical protein [Acidimicrobiales bacterium]
METSWTVMGVIVKVTVNPTKPHKARSRAGKVRPVHTVRWRVYLADLVQLERTKTFEDNPMQRIARSEFEGLLHRVAAGDRSVMLDANYHPVTAVGAEDPTVVDLVRRYWDGKWSRISPSGRKADRVALVAVCIDLVPVHERPPAGLDAYVATILLAARNEPDDDELVPVVFDGQAFSGADLATARRWLNLHSLRASQVTSDDV